MISHIVVLPKFLCVGWVRNRTWAKIIKIKKKKKAKKVKDGLFHLLSAKKQINKIILLSVQTHMRNLRKDNVSVYKNTI